MAIPSLRTWATGEMATAAMLNSNIRDTVNFLLNPPHIVLTNSAAVSIPASSWTLLSWNTELADTDNMHSIFTNPSRVTITTSGFYDLSVQLMFATTSTTDSTSRAVQIRKNAEGSATGGTRITDNRATSAASASVGSSDTIETVVEVSSYESLNAGDTIEFFAFQDTGSALNLLAQSSGDMQSFATLRWVATF